jgi:hypothetical protein
MLRPAAFQNGSRSRRLNILPLSSRGSASWKLMLRGILYFAMRDPRNADLIGADRGVRRCLDDDHQCFAEIAVGYAEHSAVTDTGKLHQRLLDFR